MRPNGTEPHKDTVLLVDDDPDLRRLLSIRLNSAGYHVIAVDSGEAALSRISMARPQVVITDLRMDGMDGITLFRTIHQDHPTLPVIILTAHGTIADAVQATRDGAFGFLTKPFDGEELLDQVRRAAQLGCEQAVDEGRAGWRAHIITRSPLMEDLLGQAHLVAQSDASVMIRGESGTGKEMLARAIHQASPRAEAPFVPINCSAIPEPLLESELFGHSKGSFTGATRDYGGLFQAANGGTLFLDEIGDLPVSLQPKLLRVLDEKLVRRVGSTDLVPVDVRIVSATHRDLERAMHEGEFREDLYYRLNVVTLELPSLAERREDIPLLVEHMLRKLCSRYRKPLRRFSVEAMEMLVTAPWPGNVRQLENVVEQAVTLATTPIISAALLESALRQRDRDREMLPLAEARGRFDQRYLVQLLRITNGNVSQAARLAKRNRTEFYKLLHRHSLDPSLFKPT
ncbi:sigma 54-interacting transcriptional regulator [Ectothiorhodospiraceae bacterium 2226]|nr:sigma 54-interacting transcriptional regulator [Ectothiorhodospiraceae bacterium 2226]